VSTVAGTPQWRGRIALIGDVTTAWDRAHDAVDPRAHRRTGGYRGRPKPDPMPELELLLARTLEELHDRSRKWLGDGYDREAMNAVLAAAAVERLDGLPFEPLGRRLCPCIRRGSPIFRASHPSQPASHLRKRSCPPDIRKSGRTCGGIGAGAYSLRAFGERPSAVVA
jgi:hypothetical protein